MPASKMCFCDPVGVGVRFVIIPRVQEPWAIAQVPVGDKGDGTGKGYISQVVFSRTVPKGDS